MVGGIPLQHPVDVQQHILIVPFVVAAEQRLVLLSLSLFHNLFLVEVLRIFDEPGPFASWVQPHDLVRPILAVAIVAKWVLVVLLDLTFEVRPEQLVVRGGVKVRRIQHLDQLGPRLDGLFVVAQLLSVVEPRIVIRLRHALLLYHPVVRLARQRRQQLVKRGEVGRVQGVKNLLRLFALSLSFICLVVGEKVAHFVGPAPIVFQHSVPPVGKELLLARVAQLSVVRPKHPRTRIVCGRSGGGGLSRGFSFVAKSLQLQLHVSQHSVHGPKTQVLVHVAQIQQAVDL